MPNNGVANARRGLNIRQVCFNVIVSLVIVGNVSSKLIEPFTASVFAWDTEFMWYIVLQFSLESLIPIDSQTVCGINVSDEPVSNSQGMVFPAWVTLTDGPLFANSTNKVTSFLLNIFSFNKL